MARGSKVSTPAPGVATPVNGATADAPIEISSLPSIVGINYGNSYASIAVITKEGISECIANEDGERQIAGAISFQDDETYIGSDAKAQLVKNSKNTITGFRNLLGKKFSEIPQSSLSITSAPLIQHPDIPDTPAYRVVKSGQETILSVSEVSTLFLRSLIGSAEDFLGRKITGAVITVPSWFAAEQRAALQKSAEDAGVTVLQLLEESGAVAVAIEAREPQLDRLALVVDLGQTALSLTLLAMRHGLAHALASSNSSDVSATQIDDRLIKFFAKDFAKKTKTPLEVAPVTTDAQQDLRAEAKLRLAIEHTKRTISASPGAATCSVESLKDGLDYTGSINRMRFDMEARPVYAAVVSKTQELLTEAGLDAHEIDEVVYVGGSGALPGLDEALGAILQEDVNTPFSAGTIVGGGAGDPTTLLARGAALQADLLNLISNEPELLAAFAPASEWENAKVLGKTIGVLFPGAEGAEGAWVPLVPRETALPARRTIELSVELGDDQRVGLEVWEAKEGVKIEKVKPPKVEDDEEPIDDEEEEEEIEEKERTLERETLLGALEVKAEASKKARIRVQILVHASGEVSASTWEVGKEENKSSFSAAA